jgi:tRNA/rRNA methyltransferase
VSRVNVVLHRPIYARNVGMCARAMANMGVSRLIVIAPQGELNEETKQGAVHAQSVLREATRYESLADFLAAEGSGLRIALSGRDGQLQKPEVLTTVLTRISQDETHIFRNPSTPIYLHFGPEDKGMSNEEMELCHFVCMLPTFGEITSLNLSHAVLLANYLVVTALHPSSNPQVKALVELKAHYHPSQTIQRWLEALGFDLSAPKVNVAKTLNRIFLSSCPSEDELRILDSVLQQTVRKLNSR